ncbi:1-acyl-sn-glycerol-3-phosphate acyltransferase gamma [Strongylocentrotus purpuratus]|uniref:Phospholipid/glycerol acyltransferase domain-containing protein n=1 Tax=Strongylocentrotus purpuratus TaxID=7668 RepID=A0A7M7PGT7_STRPU|nr:1-acyl-sn-glycerol-3-phosphate acyltransferase gamma [Strongylocentrotus purpuratus]|eukprot:XP_782135.3 PREDICTED: 1-acyl-sn-glycerol-3-phosphate acyltransferase gamma [Strongylocentrotus purpuratus]
MGLINILKQSTLTHICLWCIFIISGLIVVALQCCTLIVWPFSRRWYRNANGGLIKLFWLQYVWLVDHWSGSQLFIHCKDEDLPFIGKDDCLFVLNHRSDVDWIITWQVGARFNLLPGGKACMKDELKYVPIMGLSFYLTEQPFVKRNYTKDKENLLKQLRNITSFHFPTTTVIFCEGTRYTEEKYRLSQAFARERGLPELKHHLIPRTKGFGLCVQAFRGKNVQIYDATLAYEGGKAPTLYDVLCGKKSDCHVYARRFPLDDVPSGSEDEFCHEMYRGKDKAFDYFLQHDTFEGFDAQRSMHGFPCPRLSLYVVSGWALLIGLPILYYTSMIVISGSILKVLIPAAVLYAIYRFSGRHAIY